MQSPLSVQPCGLAYWLLTASQIPIAVGFTFWAAYTSKQDASSNHEVTTPFMIICHQNAGVSSHSLIDAFCILEFIMFTMILPGTADGRAGICAKITRGVASSGTSSRSAGRHAGYRWWHDPQPRAPRDRNASTGLACFEVKTLHCNFCCSRPLISIIPQPLMNSLLTKTCRLRLQPLSSSFSSHPPCQWCSTGC